MSCAQLVFDICKIHQMSMTSHPSPHTQNMQLYVSIDFSLSSVVSRHTGTTLSGSYSQLALGCAQVIQYYVVGHQLQMHSYVTRHAFEGKFTLCGHTFINYYQESSLDVGRALIKCTGSMHCVQVVTRDGKRKVHFMLTCMDRIVVAIVSDLCFNGFVIDHCCFGQSCGPRTCIIMLCMTKNTTKITRTEFTFFLLVLSSKLLVQSLTNVENLSYYICVQFSLFGSKFAMSGQPLFHHTVLLATSTYTASLVNHGHLMSTY